MKVKEKLLMDLDGLCEHGPITIVAFGDSVTHGCIRGMDYENVYWNCLRKKLNAYRDYVPVNMINAGIGGTLAKTSVARLDKHVLNHDPDLVIICFGLNDINGTKQEYLDALKQMFEKCTAQGVDVIFMTPNMLNTHVAEGTPEVYLDYAATTAEIQNSGKMDDYIYSAKALAESMGIAVCDCYSEWKKLSETQDITMLLENRINHPTAEMHELFANCLYDMIIGEETSDKEIDSGMYKKN